MWDLLVSMWSSFNDKRSMIQMKREVSSPFNKQLDWIFVQKRGKKKYDLGGYHPLSHP